MFPCKIGSVFVLLILGINTTFAQRTVPVEEVINQTLQRSHQLKAADALIDHDRLMEKTGGFLPDPELILESPTGKFMALGIQQSFAFPTVYAKQKQLAREQTALSEKARMISEAELRKRIKSAYLEWQSATEKKDLLKVQDSLLLSIAKAAERQHLAGQIDFVEKTYPGIKYTDIHTQYLEAMMEVEGSMHIVQRYAGISDSIIPSPFVKQVNDFTFSARSMDSINLVNTPIMAYHRQGERISEKAIKLEKHNVFPDMTIGYFNQADKSTPFPQRLRFGLSVPLWFWQYSTSIHAAEAMLTVSKNQTAAGAQDLSQAWIYAKNDALKYEIAIAYYESDGLIQATEMMKAADRMFSSGQYDYIKYLTTLSDAFNMKLKYISLVENYNQALISLQYLIGQ